MNTIEQLLDNENKILDTLLENQSALRLAGHNRDWSDLMDIISEINLLADSFKKIEFEREKVMESTGKQTQAVLDKIAEVRGKLVRSRTENKALSDYISITRGFIQGI